MVCRGDLNTVTKPSSFYFPVQGSDKRTPAPAPTGGAVYSPLCSPNRSGPHRKLNLGHGARRRRHRRDRDDEPMGRPAGVSLSPRPVSEIERPPARRGRSQRYLSFDRARIEREAKPDGTPNTSSISRYRHLRPAAPDTSPSTPRGQSRDPRRRTAGAAAPRPTERRERTK